MMYTKCPNFHRGTGYSICSCGYDKSTGKILSKTGKFFNTYLPFILIVALIAGLTLAHELNK